MVTVHYIGDSTVARNNIHSYPQTGIIICGSRKRR